ncbi:hypothetical protein ACIA8G_12220 [Lentzea sp. NPDC051213]|uniref:hypothetical protein n=1 Tax=Lentzea sp. NPDC051213 TaxID=3364126 RepID=UPI0037B64B30
MHAADVTGLPPTTVVVAGNDPLHDEDLAQARRRWVPVGFCALPADGPRLHERASNVRRCTRRDDESRCGTTTLITGLGPDGARSFFSELVFL